MRQRTRSHPTPRAQDAEVDQDKLAFALRSVDPDTLQQLLGAILPQQPPSSQRIVETQRQPGADAAQTVLDIQHPTDVERQRLVHELSQLRVQYDLLPGPV